MSLGKISNQDYSFRQRQRYSTTEGSLFFHRSTFISSFAVVEIVF